MERLLQGQIQLFCYKKGVLSKVAHDIQLSLNPCVLHCTKTHVEGRFPVDQIRVDGALVKGQLNPALLTSKDRNQILANLHTTVLESHLHPEVHLSGEWSDTQFSGLLTIKGRERPVQCLLQKSSSGLEGRLLLSQKKWDIPPFKALLGAIQIQNNIEARFRFRSVEASLSP